MSNQRYTFGNNQFLTGQLDWLNDTFKVLLVNTNNYIFLQNVHRYVTDVPTSAQIARSGALTGHSASGGVALADNLTVTSVTGPVIEALIIFHDTGNDATSELICYLDTGNGLPWNPQGGNVTVHWDHGPNGIFKL